MLKARDDPAAPLTCRRALCNPPCETFPHETDRLSQHRVPCVLPASVNTL